MSKKTNSSPASEEQAKEASAAEQNEQTAAQAKPEAEAAKQPEEKKHEDAKQQEASEFEKAQQALAHPSSAGNLPFSWPAPNHDETAPGESAPQFHLACGELYQ